jgi:glucose-6-phosphate isomerase
VQQADMESNGKSVDKHGHPVNYKTGPVIWGEQGCNGQHAFYQSLHQGSQFTPVDFVLAGADQESDQPHQAILVASCLSQAEALMVGKSTEKCLNELKNKQLLDQNIVDLANHKTIPGNKPSNVLFFKTMSPFNLGMLLALYEHKIFIQGIIWNINSFDQWGVELGKELLPTILRDLSADAEQTQHDSSTQGLIAYYKHLRSQHE